MKIKTLITGFKRTTPFSKEGRLDCTLWSSTLVEQNGVITAPFFRVLNSLPRECLTAVVPDGEKLAPTYDNATLLFGRTHMPGQWLYFEQAMDEGMNAKIAQGFVEWLQKQQKIAVVVHAYSDADTSGPRETVYWDTTGVELVLPF